MQLSELVIGKKYIAVNPFGDSVEGIYNGSQDCDDWWSTLIDMQTENGLVQLEYGPVEWRFMEVIPGEIIEF